MKNIALIYGGNSAEADISIKSGLNGIRRAIRRRDVDRTKSREARERTAKKSRYCVPVM